LWFSFDFDSPVWTSTQLKSIIDSAPDKLRGLFQSAMLTGARIGELLGLQWKHINFKELKLEIRQALWDGQLVAPEAARSVRAIYFGSALELALAVHRQNSIYTKPDDFVLCKMDGSPLNPDVLRRDVLYPMLDRLGISRTSRSSGFHTFRHSAGSIVNQTHSRGNVIASNGAVSYIVDPSLRKVKL
jgi:integrase